MWVTRAWHILRGRRVDDALAVPGEVEGVEAGRDGGLVTDQAEGAVCDGGALAELAVEGGLGDGDLVGAAIELGEVVGEVVVGEADDGDLIGNVLRFLEAGDELGGEGVEGE